jgi:hypothetical protein
VAVFVVISKFFDRLELPPNPFYYAGSSVDCNGVAPAPRAGKPGQFMKLLLLLALLPASTALASDCDTRPILKASEAIVILSEPKARVQARIDTGADYSSIDLGLAEKLGPFPIIGHLRVRNAHGVSERPVIRIAFVLKGQKRTSEFTVTPRAHLDYPVLIGRKALQGFLIDPSSEPQP